MDCNAAPSAAPAAAEGASPAAELADADQPAAPAPDEPEAGLNGLPLSKNQMKKRAKHEARLAKKAEKKEREKQERGALVAARKAEAAQRLAAMSREEKLAFREECQQKRKARPPAPWRPVPRPSGAPNTVTPASFYGRRRAAGPAAARWPLVAAASLLGSCGLRGSGVRRAGACCRSAGLPAQTDSQHGPSGPGGLRAGPRRPDRTAAAQDRQLSGKEKKARLAAALRDGQRIIIDLDYADLMTDQARLWWALAGSACALCIL
jgi:hypothetical protein